MYYNYIALFLSIFLYTSCSSDPNPNNHPDKIIAYEVETENLEMRWKNDANKLYQNFNSIKEAVEEEGKELVFAMNGGMFHSNYDPTGLYIEKGKELTPLNIEDGSGNFFLKPNGVFALMNNGTARITTTENFSANNIYYATQSGPMLLIDGAIHPKFKDGSKHVHIRNGVGVLPNGNAIFAISTEKVNLYTFANFFKEKGCKNALYLDGFVSRMYLPSENWEQHDGTFGVMIVEVK